MPGELAPSGRIGNAFWPEAMRLSAHLIAAVAFDDLVVKCVIGENEGLAVLPVHRPRAARRFVNICEFAAGVYTPRGIPDPNILKACEGLTCFQQFVAGFDPVPFQRLRIYKAVATHVTAFMTDNENKLEEIARAILDNDGVLSGLLLFDAVSSLRLDTGSLEQLWAWLLDEHVFHRASQSPFHRRLTEEQKREHLHHQCVQQQKGTLGDAVALTKEQASLYDGGINVFF